jgi:hypothetical protein
MNTLQGSYDLSFLLTKINILSYPDTMDSRMNASSFVVYS